MEETREGIDKQKVIIRMIFIYFELLKILLYNQEIDDILSGALTAEDEEAVDEELEEIIKQSLPDVPTIPQEAEIDLPSVPQEEPQQPEKAKANSIKREAVPLPA